jgi:hypothetical protein
LSEEFRKLEITINELKNNPEYNRIGLTITKVQVYDDRSNSFVPLSSLGLVTIQSIIQYQSQDFVHIDAQALLAVEEETASSKGEL